jgi:hypothetical protein
MWYTIKQHLKEADPEKFSRLPDMRALGNNRKKPETIVKDGVEYEKAEEPTLADAMTGMKDAADKFFGACDEMGLKTDELKQQLKQSVWHPVNYDGFSVRAVEGKFGSYHFQEINGKQWIDYENKDADEMSMTVDQWRGFLEEVRNAALVLGVEL